MPQIVQPSGLARGYAAKRLAVVRRAAALLRDVAQLTDLAG